MSIKPLPELIHDVQILRREVASASPSKLASVVRTAIEQTRSLFALQDLHLSDEELKAHDINSSELQALVAKIEPLLTPVTETLRQKITRYAIDVRHMNTEQLRNILHECAECTPEVFSDETTICHDAILIMRTLVRNTNFMQTLTPEELVSLHHMATCLHSAVYKMYDEKYQYNERFFYQCCCAADDLIEKINTYMPK